MIADEKTGKVVRGHGVGREISREERLNSRG